MKGNRAEASPIFLLLWEGERDKGWLRGGGTGPPALPSPWGGRGCSARLQKQLLGPRSCKPLRDVAEVKRMLKCFPGLKHVLCKLRASLAKKGGLHSLRAVLTLVVLHETCPCWLGGGAERVTFTYLGWVEAGQGLCTSCLVPWLLRAPGTSPKQLQ